MVIARTTEGDVGILPGHAPMLSVIIEGVVDVQTAEGETWVAAVDAGFLSVANNRVSILSEHAEMSHEIDLEKARQDLERASPAARTTTPPRRRSAAPRPASGPWSGRPDGVTTADARVSARTCRSVRSLHFVVPDTAPVGRRVPGQQQSVREAWMPVWQWLLELAGVLLVLPLLYGVALIVRRRLLARNGGTFELSYRMRTDPPGPRLAARPGSLQR